MIRLDRSRAGRELRALEMIRNIRHPHLLDIQFALCQDDRLVLAMPLCDQSLADRLRERREHSHSSLPVAELLGYMPDLAEAIDFLNESHHAIGNGRLAGVQHRDVKPQNVFLSGGSVRLADFGLAKILETSLEIHSGCMSPHYVAPEELHGLVSRHSDQYALAVTYYQLRTGRLPFTGSIGEVLEGHLHRAPDLSCLEDGERRVVTRGMAKRPEERWPTCRAFVNQLERSIFWAGRGDRAVVGQAFQLDVRPESPCYSAESAGVAFSDSSDNSGRLVGAHCLGSKARRNQRHEIRSLDRRAGLRCQRIAQAQFCPG